MKLKKAIPGVLFIFILSIIQSAAYAKGGSGNTPQLSIFYSPTCRSCTEIKDKLIPEIEKKFKARIQIQYYDISHIQNYRLLLSLKKKYNVKFDIRVPVIFLEGYFLNGDAVTKDSLERLIEIALSAPRTKEGGLPLVDLLAHFKGFGLFTVISAGLIDGINPCAFTVIVFFISFLALQGYTKRDLIAICLCFIFTVFITYLLIGLGVFGFLYRLNKFWVIAKAVNFLIGAFSITLGVFAVYDFFKFKRTGKTEGLTLQLPQAVKNQIHRIIGLHYRVNNNLTGASSGQRLFRLMAAALITGFIVSILEAVCTGQTYLPTIIFILRTTRLKLSALGSLLIYNFMFIVPLLAIFISALFGTTSGQFSNFLKRHMLIIKLLTAILFFGLGAFLVWRA